MTAGRSNAGWDDGALRLLADAAALARLTADRRPSARARLEHELGPELVRFLIAALVAHPRRAFA